MITATGYGYGAGIGGGNFSSGGTINIKGGTVIAISGGKDPNGWVNVPNDVKMASGIGASQGQPSGTITISGENTKVTAYGGYGCPGIGGGTSNVTIQDNAEVTAYGGTYAAGIGGYNRDKGESSITISGNATVTAYGGEDASGLGQGSVVSSVDLSIANTATVRAYSDGTKAAITGTPQNGSASILNIYMRDVVLPDEVKVNQLPLTVGDDTVYIAAGYLAVGTNFAAGTYDVSLNFPLLGMDYFKLIPAAGYSFQVSAGNSASAYEGERLMLLGVADNGATIQRNPPMGVTIYSGDDSTPLTFDGTNGMIVVPAGGSVTAVGETPETWTKGGTVWKGGTLYPNLDETFAFSRDLSSSATVILGSDLTLSVTVEEPQDGSQLSYQWYKDSEAIENETGASLALADITEEDFASYHVVVTKTLSGVTQTLTSRSCVVSLYVPSVPTYAIAVESSDNGAVTASASRAAAGSRVTLTVAPNEGYVLDSLTVTDGSGSEVTVSGSGSSYTFTMPASAVTVTATFVEGDHNCPSDHFTDVDLGLV